MDSIASVVGVAIGYLVAQAVRWLARRRFWDVVVRRARGYLEDPAVPIEDPQEAVKAALADEHSNRVRRVAESIAPKNKG